MLYVTVFDIDGTLADPSHRLHFIQDGKKDWKSFFDRVHLDTPIWPIIRMVHMHQETETPYVIVSGRSEECREATITWLSKYGINEYWRLYMRKQKDHRPDYIVKQEILGEMIDLDHFKPDLVFDDRDQVVKMWRDNGIRTCQVAYGDF